MDKFESRFTDEIFLGYTSHSRAYRVLNLETNRIVETCEITFDETIPCTTPIFETAGEHEMGQSIFEKEDERADGGDEDNDEVNRAPAVAPVPPTSTTMIDGPTSTTTTSIHQRVPLHADEEESQSNLATVEGEATSE